MFFFLVVLRIEPRALYMLDKYSTTEIQALYLITQCQLNKPSSEEQKTLSSDALQCGLKYKGCQEVANAVIWDFGNVFQEI